MGIAYTDDGQVAILRVYPGCLFALVVDATVQNFPILCEVYAVFKVVKNYHCVGNPGSAAWGSYL